MFKDYLVETWQDLANKIVKMSEEQKKQPIQCVLPTCDEGEVQEMLEGIAIRTVKEFEFYKCRSTHNNKYCGEDAVLLLEPNKFALDGAIAYEWNDNNEDIPIYEKNGKTNPEDQKSPDAKRLREKWENETMEINHIAISCLHRIDELEINPTRPERK